MSRFLAVVFLLALSGCGFHLRNALTLPPDLGPVRVEAQDRYSPLADSLAQALARAGAQPAAAGAEDVATLRILSERWGDTPIAIDQFGRAQEYSLRHAVVFEFVAADGREIVPRQAVELARDYIASPQQLTGTEGEREILARELRREMAAAILRRVDAAIRNPAQPGAAP